MPRIGRGRPARSYRFIAPKLIGAGTTVNSPAGMVTAISGSGATVNFDYQINGSTAIASVITSANSAGPIPPVSRSQQWPVIGPSGLTPGAGNPASALQGLLRYNTSRPPVSQVIQQSRAFFSYINYPNLTSILTEAISMPADSEIDANASFTGVVTGQSGVVSQGGFATGSIASISASYTAQSTDAIILANAVGGSLTVTLPDATQVTAGFATGQRYTIKKTDSTTNAITITGTSGQTIDGQASYSLSAQYATVDVLFDGANWQVIDQGVTGSSLHTLDWINVTGYGADPTGVRDSTTAIQNAINAVPAAGGVVYLPVGTYKTTAPLIINSSYIELRGAMGPGFATTLLSAATSSQTAMLIVGNTQVLFQTAIRNLAIKGGNGSIGANSGHGIVFRSGNGFIENVDVQYVSGDCYHLSLDVGSLTGAVSDVTMLNCYGSFASGDGLYLDSNFTSNEFFAVRLQGGPNSGSKGGNYGIECYGSNNKFVACHAYFWATGGAQIGSASFPIGGTNFIAGEYETNAGYGITVTNSESDIVGASCYSNTVGDIQVNGGGGSCGIYACRLRSTAGGVAFASGLDNTISGCHIQATIVESGTADFNRIIGNRLGSAPTLIGAHTQAISNIGYNPVGHIASPAIPGSTTAYTNAFGVDATVFVTGGTVSAVAIGGTSTGLTSGTFRVPAGQTITLTYSAAPTWTWFGD